MRADVHPGVIPRFDVLAPPHTVRGGSRGFLTGFVIAVVIAFVPAVILVGRLMALGEIDAFGGDQTRAGELVHGTVVERIAEYKLARTIAIRPDVLAVGSSRVLYWRGSLFEPCVARRDCFYNAGGSMATIREADDFMRAVLSSSYAPRVLLLDVAHWHFDPNFPENDHRAAEVRPSLLELVARIPAEVREILQEAQTDPDLRGLLAGARPVPPGYAGLRAILKDEGFTPDGARRLGSAYLADLESQSGRDRTAEIASRVDAAGYRFDWFDSADQRSLAELEDLVGIARQRGVQIVAFITPYADDVADAVAAQPGLRAGFADVESKLAALFARHDAIFVDPHRMSAIGCPPSEAIDGYHIGEVCSARFLLRMLDEPGVARVLAPYVRTDRLRDLIAHAPSDLLIEAR